jgi:hypothetical protein
MESFRKFSEEVKEHQDRALLAKKNTWPSNPPDNLDIHIQTEILQLRRIKEARDELLILKQVLTHQTNVQGWFSESEGTRLDRIHGVQPESQKHEVSGGTQPEYKPSTGTQTGTKLSDEQVEQHRRDILDLSYTVSNNVKAVDSILLQANEAESAVRILLALQGQDLTFSSSNPSSTSSKRKPMSKKLELRARTREKLCNKER